MHFWEGRGRRLCGSNSFLKSITIQSAFTCGRVYYSIYSSTSEIFCSHEGQQNLKYRQQTGRHEVAATPSLTAILYLHFSTHALCLQIYEINSRCRFVTVHEAVCDRFIHSVHKQLENCKGIDKANVSYEARLRSFPRSKISLYYCIPELIFTCIRSQARIHGEGNADDCPSWRKIIKLKIFRKQQHFTESKISLQESYAVSRNSDLV